MSRKTVAIANGVVDQQMTLANSALARDILGSAPHRDLPEEESEWRVEELNWEPDLNPVQMDVYKDNTLHLLAHGEKGSGKSIGAMHKVVKHCYEEENALALIITPSMRTGREGTAYELETLVLPHWTEGMGLEWKPFTTDAATKDRICWLGNKWGGWSKLLVMSIPYPEIVETRMKVMAPSIVFVDELTECKSREYLTYPVLQLGRRRGIRGKQPFIAATNPAGPSHWVYEAFFVGGRDDSDFATIHVPFSDNASRIPEGYKERLAKMLAYDPIAYKQLVHGEWIDRPSGEGMFSAQYQPSVHRIGDKSMGLAPSMGFPITVGLDLGDVWSSVVFMQGLPVERNGESTLMWKMFDELAYLNEKTTNKAIVGDIIERMDYWDDYADKKFMYDFWSDSSALIRWRPVGTGGYDATEIARYSENRIRLKPAPKFKGSIEARVRLVQQVLYDERFFVSHRCQHMHEVFLYLEKQEKFPMKPKRSKYIHSFDALGYALMGVEMNGQRRPLDEPMVEIVRLGGRR